MLGEDLLLPQLDDPSVKSKSRPPGTRKLAVGAVPIGKNNKLPLEGVAPKPLMERVMGIFYHFLGNAPRIRFTSPLHAWKCFQKSRISQPEVLFHNRPASCVLWKHLSNQIFISTLPLSCLVNLLRLIVVTQAWDSFFPQGCRRLTLPTPQPPQGLMLKNSWRLSPNWKKFPPRRSQGKARKKHKFQEKP